MKVNDHFVSTGRFKLRSVKLIAQAQSTLAGNPNSSYQNINALGQALEGLKSALAAKAGRLQESKSKDTGAADQEIATRKQAMQTELAVQRSPGCAILDDQSRAIDHRRRHFQRRG